MTKAILNLRPGAQAALTRLRVSDEKKLTEIVAVVAHVFNLDDVRAIMLPSPGLSNPARRVAIFLARESTGLSTTRIGEFFQCNKTLVSKTHCELNFVMGALRQIRSATNGSRA